VSLPTQFDGFHQKEFSDFTGVTMNGQTLSIDFRFEGGAFLESVAPVWAEILLQTAPRNTPNLHGDYPYSQYVVFGAGTSAYLLNENGEPLYVPMDDWRGGVTRGPAATLPVLWTDHGLAGGDMLAFPSLYEKIGGIHFDLVLPNTGERIFLGRLGLRLETAYRRQAIPVDPSLISIVENLPDSPVENFPVLPVDLPVVVPQIEVIPPNTANPPMVGTNFAVPSLGAIVKTADTDGRFVWGYGRIGPAAGSASPSGMLILKYRNSGALVDETLVPDSPPLSSGRVYVEVKSNGRVNTQISVANPNRQDAAINFEIRDTNGNIERLGSFMVRGTDAGCDPGLACNQVSGSLDNEPFWGGTDIQGTLTFTATAPVVVFAARVSTTGGHAADFLMTPLPVIDLSMSPSREAQVIPHFAVGDGRRTELVLVNPGGTTLSGSVQFSDPYGGQAFVSTDGTNFDSSLKYFIAPNSLQTFVITHALRGHEYGSVKVIPTGDTPAPSSFVLHSYEQMGVTTFEIAVPVTMGQAFRMYAELSPSQQIRTGIALANATNSTGTVWLSLTGSDGALLGTASFQLQPSSQIVDFLDSLIPSLANQAVNGVLRITTDLESISVTGLRGRYNERQQYLLTTVSPVIEEGQSGERFFPFVINGGGFTTDVVLFSGTGGQSSSGILSFVEPYGTPLDLGIH
jgi:hypothetical protein